MKAPNLLTEWAIKDIIQEKKIKLKRRKIVNSLFTENY